MNDEEYREKYESIVRTWQTVGVGIRVFLKVLIYIIMLLAIRNLGAEVRNVRAELEHSEERIGVIEEYLVKYTASGDAPLPPFVTVKEQYLANEEQE